MPYLHLQNILFSIMSFSDIDPNLLLAAGIAIVLLIALFLLVRYNVSRSPGAVAEVAQNGLKISVKYAQPFKKGRVIFGDVVPYGKVWRTGANAATLITLDRNVFVADQPLPKGTYSLFSIPNETDDWTLIFNGQKGQWGVRYDQAKDVLRVPVSARAYEPGAEQFFISFEPQPNGMIMLLTWDHTQVVVPFRKR